MAEELKCFKAYDVRGRIPDELNPELAQKIARAYAGFLTPKRVVVGHDIRLSSPELAESVIEGLLERTLERVPQVVGAVASGDHARDEGLAHPLLLSGDATVRGPPHDPTIDRQASRNLHYVEYRIM